MFLSSRGRVEVECVDGFVERCAIWEIDAGLADALPAGAFIESDRGGEVDVHVEDGPQVAGLSLGGRGCEKPSAGSLPALLWRYQQAGDHSDAVGCDVEAVAGERHHRLRCRGVQGDVTNDGVVGLGDPGAEGAGVAEEGTGGIAEVNRVAITEV